MNFIKSAVRPKTRPAGLAPTPMEPGNEVMSRRIIRCLLYTHLWRQFLGCWCVQHCLGFLTGTYFSSSFFSLDLLAGWGTTTAGHLPLPTLASRWSTSLYKVTRLAWYLPVLVGKGHLHHIGRVPNSTACTLLTCVASSDTTLFFLPRFLLGRCTDDEMVNEGSSSISQMASANPLRFFWGLRNFSLRSS